MTDPVVRSSRTPSPIAGDGAIDYLHEPDELLSANARDDTNAESEQDAPPGMPRWVKVFGIAAVTLLLIVAGLHLSGNAPTHGMPMHTIQLP
jgi:hypothetical protein